MSSVPELALLEVEIIVLKVVECIQGAAVVYIRMELLVLVFRILLFPPLRFLSLLTFFLL
jgi:hypothetical protein